MISVRSNTKVALAIIVLIVALPIICLIRNYKDVHFEGNKVVIHYGINHNVFDKPQEAKHTIVISTSLRTAYGWEPAFYAWPIEDVNRSRFWNGSERVIMLTKNKIVKHKIEEIFLLTGKNKAPVVEITGYKIKVSKTFFFPGSFGSFNSWCYLVNDLNIVKEDYNKKDPPKQWF